VIESSPVLQYQTHEKQLCQKQHQDTAPEYQEPKRINKLSAITSPQILLSRKQIELLHIQDKQINLQSRCCQCHQAQQQPTWNGRGSKACIQPLFHRHSTMPKQSNSRNKSVLQPNPSGWV